MSNWATPPGTIELRHDEIHLWRADLDRSLYLLPALMGTLPSEERRKASGSRSSLDRDRQILRRAILRSILARYLKTSPRDLEFRDGPRGTLRLTNGTVRFNASHSDGLAIYAISRAREVGVDIERVRPGPDKDISAWFLSLRAIRFLDALPQPARCHAFFQAWTRMEAYSKARGQGLMLSLEDFEIFLGGSNPVFLRAPQPPWERAPLWLHDFLPRKGYVASLAAQESNCRLRYWKWQARPYRPVGADGSKPGSSRIRISNLRRA